jgi:hypothetical protein
MRHKTARDALSAVSYLFLAVGLLALSLMIRHAIQGAFHFNFGILGIGVFAGLRRYSRIWRVCALLFTWYGIVTVSITLYICLAGEPPVTAPLLRNHHRLSTIPANWLSIPLVMVLLVTLWQYRVLTHPAIRRLFIEEPRPSSVPEQRPIDEEMDGAVVK